MDLNALLADIDLDAVLGRLDLNVVMEGLDLDALLARLDVNAIVGGVDVNAIVSTLDVDSLVENTEIGGIIAKSTSGVASSALDAVRAQGVGLDEFIGKWTSRVLRRDLASLPAGPPKLVSAERPALPPVETANGHGTNNGNSNGDRSENGNQPP